MHCIRPVLQKNEQDRCNLACPASIWNTLNRTVKSGRHKDTVPLCYASLYVLGGLIILMLEDFINADCANRQSMQQKEAITHSSITLGNKADQPKL